jgi:hypothetical protein
MGRNNRHLADPFIARSVRLAFPGPFLAGKFELETAECCPGVVSDQDVADPLGAG